MTCAPFLSEKEQGARGPALSRRFRPCPVPTLPSPTPPPAPRSGPPALRAEPRPGRGLDAGGLQDRPWQAWGGSEMNTYWVGSDTG